jgi:hypothetical protein
MMTHPWTRKLCAMLIAICCFTTAFPSKSDASTAYYTDSYNSYVYYYNLWHIYGYDYNTYVLGYAYPNWYMYNAGLQADYWIWYITYYASTYLPNAQYWVHQYATSRSESNAATAQYYWNNY